MTASEIDYQKSLLDDVVEEAVEQRLITTEDAEDIRDRVSSADSPRAVDDCWDDLRQDYDLFSRFSGHESK